MICIMKLFNRLDCFTSFAMTVWCHHEPFNGLNGVVIQLIITISKQTSLYKIINRLDCLTSFAMTRSNVYAIPAKVLFTPGNIPLHGILRSFHSLRMTPDLAIPNQVGNDVSLAQHRPTLRF